MNRTLFSVLWCLVVTHACFAATGQDNNLIKQIQQANQFSSLSYSYTIELLDMRKNSVTDSIKGHYVQAGDAYCDSSSAMLTLLSEGYYCSIDYQRRQLDVYNLAALKKRMGKPIDQKSIAAAMAALPETDKINMKVDSTATLLRITYTLKNNPGLLTYMEVRRSDFGLLLLRYETPDDVDAPGQYKRICTISNLVYTGQQVMRLNTVFTVKGKTIVPAPRYQHYHLNTLTE